MFHEVYRSAEAEAFGKAALVVVSTDVVVNIDGKAASCGSPAMRMKHKKAGALIMDAIQLGNVSSGCGRLHDPGAVSSVTCMPHSIVLLGRVVALGFPRRCAQRWGLPRR